MKASIKSWVALLLMLTSAVLASALKPTISLAEQLGPIQLDKMIPTSFEDWREETNVVAQVINPQQKSLLEQIYSQTLSRSYVNGSGYRIMLSIAYGKNQSDALQLHKPEFCYPAQGFALIAQQNVSLNLLGSSTEARRLATRLGPRFEPITYWTIVGDEVVRGSLEKKMVEIKHALKKQIPDGMLIRVSSIDKQTDDAYAMQWQFANAMVASISPEYRSRFAGVSNKSAIQGIPQ